MDQRKAEPDRVKRSPSNSPGRAQLHRSCGSSDPARPGNEYPRSRPTDQSQPLILTGDLNDTVQAATTQMPLLGPPGSEIGTAGFNTPDQGDRQRLWNLAPLMPEGKNYSRVNQGRNELIGHILVSAQVVKPLDGITIEAIINSTAHSTRSSSPDAEHPTDHRHIERRVKEGKSRRDATRCLKRYLARNLYRLLEHSPLTT